MPIDYARYKAHPTTYAGIKFRSRLEAKWAALFDCHRWPWTYEPFDLENWSPDFALRAKADGLRYLVEIKLTERFDADTALRIAQATPWSDFDLVLLLGLAPIFLVGGDQPRTQLGWAIGPIGRMAADQWAEPFSAEFEYADVIIAGSCATTWAHASNLVQYRKPRHDD